MPTPTRVELTQDGQTESYTFFNRPVVQTTTTSALNVRLLPGINQPVLRQLPSGAAVQYYADLVDTSPADTYSWVELVAGGWVAREFLAPKANALTLGVDVSHWQGAIDFQKLAAKALFGFVRCSNGTTKDIRFDANWHGIQQTNMVRAVTHYYRTDIDPILQADKVAQITGAIAPLYAVDMEADQNTLPHDPSRLLAFLQRLEGLTGNEPIIYTRANVWRQFFPTLVTWASEYDLWIAHYHEPQDGSEPPPGFAPDVPIEWKDKGWRFWQFSQTGKGSDVGVSSTYIDRDYFNGSEAELRDYAKPVVAPPVPVTGLAPLTGEIQIVDKGNGRDNPNQFRIGNQPWSAYAKLGVNIAHGIVAQEQIRHFWYEEGQFYVNISASEWGEMLNQCNHAGGVDVRQMNIALVRMFLPHEHVTLTPQGKPDVERLKNLTMARLNELASRNMRMILCFNSAVDYHYFHEENNYRNLANTGHLNYQYWQDKAWRLAMLPFIKDIVKEIKDHPGLFGYQLFNEPHPNGHTRDTVLRFVDGINEISRAVYDIDSKHPQMIGLRHAGDARWQNATLQQAGELVWGSSKTNIPTPYITAITAHQYSVEGASDYDAAWEESNEVDYTLFTLAPNTERPCGLTEFMSRIPADLRFDQAEQIRRYLNRMYARGLDFAAFWAYTFKARKRLGDNKRGFSQIARRQDGSLEEGNPAFDGIREMTEKLSKELPALG